MKIEKTTCPYCGAPLKIAPGQKTAKCDYCDSSVLITDTEPFPNVPVSAETDRGNTKSPMPGVSDETRESTPERHSLFPPPGFRSKNIAHMITAVIGYLFILYIAIDMDTITDTFFFIIGSLSVIDICTDWTGVYSRLAGLRSPNTFVRIVMKVVWGALIFFAWIILMVILELVLRI